ncbi:gp74 [Escherichia phage phiEB49]|uniref:Gp74 n=1 Tax=Escherichia phage phiEB49 TaxID=1048207 RepID=F8UBY4_9CAUD|nr:gp74 [Escherichia phage phiEB49]AEI91274.1 gp74 [Escherichia phage phiEB49]
MNQDTSKPSLGDIVRYMVREALASEDGACAIPYKMIYKKLNDGFIEKELCDSYFKPGGKYSIPKLKASYVSNTASRMQEVKDANKRARFSVLNMEFGDDPCAYCVKLTMVDGAVKTGTRAKTNNQLEEKAVNEFKARLLKLSPSVAGMSGDELKGAVAMINAYQEMIKDTK